MNTGFCGKPRDPGDVWRWQIPLSDQWTSLASPLPAALSSVTTLHPYMLGGEINMVFSYYLINVGCNFRAVVAPS